MSLNADSTSTFLNSLGFCSHFEWVYEPDTVYDAPGNWTKIVDMAVDAGFSWMRAQCNNSPTQKWFTDAQNVKLDYAQSKGLKFTFLAGQPKHEDWFGTLPQIFTLAGQRYGKSLLAIESPNEFDYFSGTADWPQVLADWLVKQRNALRADPVLKNTTLMGPSMVGGDGPTKLQNALNAINAGQVFERNTIHPYRGATMPAIQGMTEEAKKYSVFGNYGLVATEWGYATSTGDALAVDQRTQAVFTLRSYLTHYAFGVRHSAIYEFCDHNLNTADRESNFGVVKRDLSPKLSYTAVKNLTTMLGSKNNPKTGTLNATITKPTDGRYLTFIKDTGAYALILWREVPIAAAPAHFNVVAPGLRCWVGTPSQGPGLCEHPATASGIIDILVGDDPVVLVLKP